jgi:hypothetical protein
MAGNGIQEEILKQADKNFNAETEFLSHLVEIKSLVGQEGEDRKFYAEACRKLGMKIKMSAPELWG